MNKMDEKLIYDIGMHNGDDAVYYLNLGYTVIAVEANPLLVDLCKKKLHDYISNNKLIIINKGISNQSGKFYFWVNKVNSEWSSFNKDIGTRNNTPASRIEVSTIRMNELFEKYEIPYYLKVDIEGYDIHCIESITPGNKPRYLSCEARSVELLDVLRSKGYTKFKMINQANGFRKFSYVEEVLFLPSLFFKIVWKLRKFFLPNTILCGSSGPFGEQTSGKWESYEVTKENYLSYHKNGRTINRLSWYDFHATF